MVGSSSALTAVPLVLTSCLFAGLPRFPGELVGLRLGRTATSRPNWRGVGIGRTSRTSSTISAGTAYQSRSSSSSTSTAASLMTSSPVEVGLLWHSSSSSTVASSWQSSTCARSSLMYCRQALSRSCASTACLT